jgi:hypothetical protein
MNENIAMVLELANEQLRLAIEKQRLVIEEQKRRNEEMKKAMALYKTVFRPSRNRDLWFCLKVFIY